MIVSGSMCWTWPTQAVGVFPSLFLSLSQDMSSSDTRDLLQAKLMISCGMSLIYLIGAFVNWRILALIGIVPCLIQLLSLPFILDSPRWLAKVGRLKESDSSLQRLRGKNVDVYKEANEIRDYTNTLQQQTEVGLGLMILQQFGGINGIVFYANSIFTSAGFSKSIGTIAMVVVKIPMTTLGVFLLDKSGRRPLLLWELA